MSNFQNQKVRIEYANGTWAFIDPAQPRNKLPVEQALVDVTFMRPNLVEGYVRSVHGVDMEMVKYLDSRTRAELGLTGTHRLGRTGSMNRVRLMPNGSIERVA